MPVEMQGRRIEASNGREVYDRVTQAGDYTCPIAGMVKGVLCVYFLLPTARDNNAPVDARSIHHVQSPPHRFIEEPDGTLTIRESIGAGANSPGGYYWHGFLTNGKWELNKSKP